MSKKILSKKKKLLVVAHPDDETIFFAGLLMSARKFNWQVICVTDGNADGLGSDRQLQFRDACEALGARSVEFFNLPDRYEVRLSQTELAARLRELVNAGGKPIAAYTHGPLGEYGHPHHQDVSLAVHEAFFKKCPVWGVAYNCSPDQTVHLTKAQFKKKSEILARVYLGETSRFIQYLPATAVETFARFDINEVRSLHQYFADPKIKTPKRLIKYRWFEPYLSTFRETMINRPF